VTLRYSFEVMIKLKLKLKLSSRLSRSSTCSSMSVLARPSTTGASLAIIHTFLIAERHDEQFTVSLNPTTLRDGRVLA
jgi:hypothetical protein